MINAKGSAFTLDFAREVGRRRRLGLRAIINLRGSLQERGEQPVSGETARRDQTGSSPSERDVARHRLSALVRLLARTAAAADRSKKQTSERD